MQHDQVVEFIDWRKTTTMVKTPDGFRFKPKGQMAFLQRLAWKFLRRTHAMEFYFEEVSTVTRHRIDATSFMEKLFKQKSSIFRNFNMKPTQLLIGSETYHEMMGAPGAHQYFTFEAQYHTSTGMHTKVMGLTVQVIPWMTGMVVMP